MTSAKSKAERPQTRSLRREPEDRRPPLLRAAPSRERPRAREEDRHLPEDYSYAEEPEEEEAREEEDEVRPEVKAEEAPALERRRPEKNPEPRHPPRGAARGKGKKRKRRGGSKHQRHYRERDDPLRTSHRKLDKSRLEFAPDLRSGLERRAQDGAAGNVPSRPWLTLRRRRQKRCLQDRRALVENLLLGRWPSVEPQPRSPSLQVLQNTI